MDIEIKKEMQMNYSGLCNYLQKKYGIPIKDYYCNPSCKSKSEGISRTSEGLIIHHNAEGWGVGSNLGEQHIARFSPFEYQKKENLSYCNLIEHLLLHLRISSMGCSRFEWPFELSYFSSRLGFYWIAKTINTIYKGQGSILKWLNSCYMVIKPMFNDYIGILRGALCFLNDNYFGEKEISITEGKCLCWNELSYITYINGEEVHKNINTIDVKSLYEKRDLFINKVYADENKVEVVLNGKQMEKPLDELQSKYSYKYQMDCITKQLCFLDDGSIWTDLFEELNKPFSVQDKEVAVWIKDNI